MVFTVGLTQQFDAVHWVTGFLKFLFIEWWWWWWW